MLPSNTVKKNYGKEPMENVLQCIYSTINTEMLLFTGIKWMCSFFKIRKIQLSNKELWIWIMSIIAVISQSRWLNWSKRDTPNDKMFANWLMSVTMVVTVDRSETKERNAIRCLLASSQEVYIANKCCMQ